MNQKLNETFQIRNVTQALRKALKLIQERSEVPFQPICFFLEQFCIVFTQLNSFLGLAFNDVKKKLNHIYNNNKRFPNHLGFLSLIETQMKNKIHILNGSNNSQHNAPFEYENYSSTARNLLRVMWLMNFIKITFESCRDTPNEKLSSILANAYDTAFGQKHTFVIRQASKVAIYAFTQDRSRFIEIILGKYDQKIFAQANQNFLRALTPVYEFLLGFYKKCNLIDLE